MLKFLKRLIDEILIKPVKTMINSFLIIMSGKEKVRNNYIIGNGIFGSKTLEDDNITTNKKSETVAVKRGFAFINLLVPIGMGVAYYMFRKASIPYLIGGVVGYIILHILFGGLSKFKIKQTPVKTELA